jgi:hypothetical protein
MSFGVFQIHVLQYTKRKEAEAQLRADEERLRKQMNAKMAKEEAERLHQVIDQE